MSGNVSDRSAADFLATEVSTIRSVLPHVAVVVPVGWQASDGTSSNFLVVASREPLPEQSLRAALAATQRRARLITRPSSTVLSAARRS